MDTTPNRLFRIHHNIGRNQTTDSKDKDARRTTRTNGLQRTSTLYGNVLILSTTYPTLRTYS